MSPGRMSKAYFVVVAAASMYPPAAQHEVNHDITEAQTRHMAIGCHVLHMFDFSAGARR